MKTPKLSARNLLRIVFLVGLIYIVVPGPTSIKDFLPLPGSTRSDLPGDTYQNPNIVAYYSNFDRAYITKFYRSVFEQMPFFFFPLPVIRINHRVEDAYQYVRDQQESTFLEEFVHPLRESIFVNGYEPTVENQILGRPGGFLENHIYIYDQYFVSKATLRFYPSNILARLTVYLGIWVLGGMLLRLYVKVWREKYES